MPDLRTNPEEVETMPPPSCPAPPSLGDAARGMLIVLFTLLLAFSQRPRDLSLLSPFETMMAGALFSALAGAVGAWFFVCHRPGLSLRQGMRLTWPGARWMLAAACAGMALGVIAAWVSEAIGLVDRTHGRLDGLVGYGLCVAYLLLGPLGEEAFHRGFVLQALVGKFGANTGIAILTVGRATFIALASENRAAVFMLVFAADLVFALMRHFSKSLWPSIVTNGISTALFYIVIVSAA